MEVETFVGSLYLLSESSDDLLSKLYHCKKMSTSQKYKPAFLSRKGLEASLKVISKKYPNTEAYQLGSSVSELYKSSTEVIDACQMYYCVTGDLVTYKELACSIINSLSGDITIDMTSHAQIGIRLLEIVSTLVRAFILWGQIEDRKLLLACYALCFESVNRSQDANFMCIKEFLISYEVGGLKKLASELIPFSKLFEDIAASCVDDFRTFTLEGKQMQSTSFFNMSALPQLIALPMSSHIPELQCCGVSSFIKWFYFGALVFPQFTVNSVIGAVLDHILHHILVVPVFRDEAVAAHRELISVLEQHKLGKKAKEVSDWYHSTLSTFAAYHKDRRDYFSYVIREANLLVMDQPGLCGPKLLHILQMLALSYDEIQVLLTHCTFPDAYKSKKYAQEIFDISVNQLINETYSLKESMMKYSLVIQRYFIQFLGEHDTIAMDSIINKVEGQGDAHDVELMKGIRNACASMHVELLSNEQGFNDTLCGIRLDWMRLQYRHIFNKSKNCCSVNPSVSIINNIYFHTKGVDSLKSLMHTSCPLHQISFFSLIMDQLIKESLANNSMLRFACTTYMMFGETVSNQDKLCSDEMEFVIEQCMVGVDTHIDMAVKSFMMYFGEMWRCFRDVCKGSGIQVAVNSWLIKFCENKKDLAKKLQLSTMELPGSETKLSLKGELPELTQAFANLHELCLSFNSYRCVKVHNREFYTRQSIIPYMETFIKSEILGFLKRSDTNTVDKSSIPDPRRPSELLIDVKGFLYALSTLNSMMDLNLNSLFYMILLSFSVPQEMIGQQTIASFYSSWYLNGLLSRNFRDGTVLFSAIRGSLIVKSTCTFRAEEYTDPNEMRAIAELVGPYGVRTICQDFNMRICSELDCAKKFVQSCPTTFVSLEKITNSQVSLDEVFKKLKGFEEVISSLITVGAIMALKGLLLDGLKYVLETKSPLVMTALKYSLGRVYTEECAARIFQAAGYSTMPVDYELSECFDDHEVFREIDKDLWTKHLLNFFILAIAYVAVKEGCEYISAIEAYTNNLHLLILAIKKLIPALFTRYRIDDSVTREVSMNEFLKNLSTVIIKMYQNEIVSIPIRSKESIVIAVDLLAQGNEFIDSTTIEKYMPMCLITSINNRLIQQSKNALLMKRKAKGQKESKNS